MKHDGISLTSPVPDAFPGTVWERCGDVSETFQRGDGHFCLKHASQRRVSFWREARDDGSGFVEKCRYGDGKLESSETLHCRGALKSV
ncbi:hypothetical protein F2Q70_00033148 [Brassica cretica]|uniref:Uncharacterized protein n=1 Tax=Brassica cretica TaxID=69181 RepID=A0A8S9FJ30_BRACR|nr:hypothetical protein F2Q70_00033148 [Brassica cretica]